MCSTGIDTAAELEKHHSDGQDVSPMPRLCAKLSETLMNLSSGCPLLAKSHYRGLQDTVGNDIHWLSLKKHWIPT